MSASGSGFTLGKEERIKSKRLADTLFGGGKSRSMQEFPIRMVYMTVQRTDSEAAVKMMVSVPKRHFKHAVDRNRVKRQIREAYRCQKQLLQPDSSHMLAIAFIWMDARLRTSEEVSKKVRNLLIRLDKKL